MWPKFTNFVADNVASIDKFSYLNCIRHKENLELQNNSDKKLISETIVKWLKSPLTRYDGLMLWNVSLEKSDLYLLDWGNLLKASLELSASSCTRRVALKILNQTVLKFGNKSEYNPGFQRFMPILLGYLLLDLEDNEELVLSCNSLVICIKHLPQLLGSFVAEIERFIVKHFDNEAIEVVEALADVFAVFPNCNARFLKPKVPCSAGWVDLYSKAVNTLESLVEDILFFHTGSNAPRAGENNKPVFTVPCSSEGGLTYLCHKLRVFYSLSRSLSKLICTESLGVNIFLEDLLEIIRRLISLPEETASIQTDHSLHHLIFPQMCKVGFMLLEAIVLNFNVVEHTDNILEMALKANAQIFSQTPVHPSEVQLSTWKFLNIWIKQSGCSVSCKIVSGEIIGQLLSGIMISKAQNNESVLIKQICTEALKVLNVLITSACYFFNEENIEFLTTTILQIVKQIQFHSHPLKSFPSPYSDVTCRVELYNLLLTCCVTQHPFQKNCIVKSVNLFKMAQRDPCIDVANVCHKACNLFVYFLNPKKPPPDYTLPIHIEAPQLDRPNEEVDADWEVPNDGNWQPEQLNGQGNNLHAPVLYQEGGVYHEDLVDNENSQERADGLHSSPHYAVMGPSNQYNNVKTSSRNSSPSEDLDESESEEEEVGNKRRRKNSIKKKPCNRVPNKNKHAPANIPLAQKANRPNIQILEARSATTASANEARSDEDSSDANVTVVRDVQSDQNSMEEDESPMPSPKRVVSENGGAEESDEEDLDEEDDEVEEEDDEAAAGDFAEEILSSEPEERPIKKKKSNTVEEMSSEEDSNRPSAECEEIGSGEDVKDDSEINPEVNGQSENALKKDSPTVEEMMADFVLVEAVDS